ncbi:Uncharacterised protein [Mycobacteroides abscessus subsp. abscessus]|nr:Uncharacterised protein [Mycobacteroides abscessus subsp. abscessus]
MCIGKVLFGLNMGIVLALPQLILILIDYLKC